MIGHYLLRQASRLGQFEALLEPIQAQIQAELGEFLQAKAFLLQARATARTPEDLLRADELLGEQVRLEAQLGIVLPPIQAGEFTAASLANATAFAVRLASHMGDVRSLRRRLGPLPPAGAPWGQVVLWGGGALAVLMLVGMLARRR